MDGLISIGQVAKRLGVSVDVVRAMEERGELKGRRTPGGHRRYHSADVERVRTQLRAGPTKSKSGQSPNSARRPSPRAARTPWFAEPDGFDVEQDGPSDEELEAEAERETAKERAAAEAKALAV